MITLNADACTGCGTCVKACPHRVLELNDRKAFLSVEARCIECGACQLNCHHGAIEVTKGTGCLVTIIREDILGVDKGRAMCGCG
jgi:NAD-dependent dihydropyrimidine dehydrogenase PreA subunit